MMDTANVDGKWSEKKMEGDDGLRTVECLRGRLLAERVASRVAKENAEQLGNKLIELENQLKQERKSRNRAEKRLKLLTKKLNSMNISVASEESKTEISSVSSTASSIPRPPPADQEKHKKPITNSSKSDTESENLSHIASESGSNQENSMRQADFEESSGVDSAQNNNGLKVDDHGFNSSYQGNEINEEDDEDRDQDVDNSLALVPINLPEKQRMIDPAVLDATVRDVLDALRHAKEKLQFSMGRRQAIQVGSR